MDIEALNISEIAKMFGGLIAFAVVLYVGIIFYRREANFSGEYNELIEQYKSRNESLSAELDHVKEVYSREIEDLKTRHNAEIKILKAQMNDLKEQIAALKKLIGS